MKLHVLIDGEMMMNNSEKVPPSNTASSQVVERNVMAALIRQVAENIWVVRPVESRNTSCDCVNEHRVSAQGDCRCSSLFIF